MHPILEFEGGLFGLGGVTERSVSVAWHLQALSFSVVPDLARVGESLGSAVVNRRASVADLFPCKDPHKWLSAEAVSHIAALAKAPRPVADVHNKGRQASRARATTTFLSECEIEAICNPRGSTI